MRWYQASMSIGSSGTPHASNPVFSVSLDISGKRLTKRGKHRHLQQYLAHILSALIALRCSHPGCVYNTQRLLCGNLAEVATVCCPIVALLQDLTPGIQLYSIHKRTLLSVHMHLLCCRYCYVTIISLIPPCLKYSSQSRSSA